MWNWYLIINFICNFRIANFVDKFGSRMTGSQNLEDSIDYVLDIAESEGLENIHTHDVDVNKNIIIKYYSKSF